MGLYHGWDHDPDTHADFVRGGVTPDDFEKEVNYKPRRKKKGCKKSKDGSPCKFTIPVVVYSYTRGEFRHDYMEDSCERCGKRNWSSYRRVTKRIQDGTGR